MFLKTLAVAAAFLATVPASAAVIGDFRLDGSLVNQSGGPLTLTNNGATLGATGVTFAANQGPTITGFSAPSDFSVEFRFSFSNLGTYRKLADFLDRGSDTGLYVHDRKLFFFNIKESVAPVFTADQLATVVFTRAADGASAGYVNGAQVISFTNAAATALQTNLHLFRDDLTNGAEASPGFVDYIRIYDTALSATEVAALTPPGPAPAVPEPATWAMMIAGFGLAGATARRRSTARVLA